MLDGIELVSKVPVVTPEGLFEGPRRAQVRLEVRRARRPPIDHKVEVVEVRGQLYGDVAVVVRAGFLGL
jgi:hypothetical protein